MYIDHVHLSGTSCHFPCITQSKIPIWPHIKFDPNSPWMLGAAGLTPLACNGGPPRADHEEDTIHHLIKNVKVQKTDGETNHATTELSSGILYVTIDIEVKWASEQLTYHHLRQGRQSVWQPSLSSVMIRQLLWQPLPLCICICADLTTFIGSMHQYSMTISAQNRIFFTNTKTCHWSQSGIFPILPWPWSKSSVAHQSHFYQ